MNQVKKRLDMAHYINSLRAALKAAGELGFNHIEQACLLGYVIENADDLSSVKAAAQDFRNLETEKRADYFLKIAAKLDKKFGGDTARMREWLETKPGTILDTPRPRELLLSAESSERIMVALLLS